MGNFMTENIGIGSPAYYMNPNVLKKRVDEGYAKASFGGGEWVDDARIVSIWAFYHPDGRISTYEHPKAYDHCFEKTIHGSPYEKTYTRKEFKEYLKKYKIKLSKKIMLEEIILEEKRLER